MRRVTFPIVMLTISLVAVSGCAKKKPATAAAPAAPAVVAPAAAAPATAATPADPLAGDLAAVNEYVRAQGLLRPVYYAYDSADLSQEALQTLAANARFLNEHPAFVITLEGHCDERGTEEYNLALGERRAGAAREYLTRLGVAPDRLRPISYGKERPLCSEPAESCWWKNRRSDPLIAARRDAS